MLSRPVSRPAKPVNSGHEQPGFAAEQQGPNRHGIGLAASLHRVRYASAWYTVSPRPRTPIGLGRWRKRLAWTGGALLLANEIRGLVTVIFAGPPLLNAALGLWP
jgi:hypothetical protein